MTLQKIISGGQTGVDRGALDAAIEMGVPHGGYCPAGRRAEDGRIPAYYQLTETESRDYRVRTEQNILASDATLIVTRVGVVSTGTRLTSKLVQRHQRPGMMFLFLRDGSYLGFHLVAAIRWLREERIATLNVAGPRESKAPGIQEATCGLLVDVIRALRERP